MTSMPRASPRSWTVADTPTLTSLGIELLINNKLQHTFGSAFLILVCFALRDSEEQKLETSAVRFA